MTPDPPVPLLHNGPLSGLASAPGWRNGWYAAALANTRTILTAQGHENPLSYDRLHQPMPARTRVLARVLEQADGRPVLHRSLYGNAVGGGAPGMDAKARAGEPLPGLPWASTAPSSWMRQAGRAIRETFPGPCCYET